MHDVGKKRMKRKTILLCSILGLWSTAAADAIPPRMRVSVAHGIGGRVYLATDAMDIKIEGTRG